MSRETLAQWQHDGKLESNIQLIRDLANSGIHIKDIAKELEMSEVTLHALKERHPVVKDALLGGRIRARAETQRKLSEIADDPSIPPRIRAEIYLKLLDKFDREIGAYQEPVEGGNKKDLEAQAKLNIYEALQQPVEVRKLNDFLD